MQEYQLVCTAFTDTLGAMQYLHCSVHLHIGQQTSLKKKTNKTLKHLISSMEKSTLQKTLYKARFVARLFKTVFQSELRNLPFVSVFSPGNKN